MPKDQIPDLVIPLPHCSVCGTEVEKVMAGWTCFNCYTFWDHDGLGGENLRNSE